MALIPTMFESNASLYRPNIARDVESGVTQDPFYFIYAGIPCGMRDNGSSQMDIYGQRNTKVGTTLWFAQDPRCEINDRFQVLNTRTNILYYLNVIGEAEPVSRGRLWSVACEKIREPGLYTTLTQ